MHIIIKQLCLGFGLLVRQDKILVCVNDGRITICPITDTIMKIVHTQRGFKPTDLTKTDLFIF